MVFRRDNKSDSFQRQMSAIRQQIGGEEEEAEERGARDTRPANRPTVSDGPTGAYGFSEFASSVQPGQAASPSAPAMPNIPAVDAQTTVVAHDTLWKGEMSSQGTVHVHGRFEGALRVTNDVFVAEEADIDATITASNVVVAGLAKGTIRCENRFEVLPTGRVAGDIAAPTLVIHEGAIVSGQLRMSASELPESKPTSVVQRRATRGTA